MAASMDDIIQSAVEKFLVDNQGSVDPIGQRQIKSWIFEWASSGTATNVDSQVDQGVTDNTYSGRLTWKIDNPEHPFYIVLSTHCSWTDTSLDWTCRVRAELATPSTDSKSKKIAKKLKERLEKDDYVAKLFACDRKEHDRAAKQDAYALDDDASVDGVVLAQASIQTPDSGLEERVLTDSDVAEGIRRAIWNTAQDPIEVLEFVIQYLPLLPCTSFSLNVATTKLADRAVLRLLEDAMCDACDREGEEELVQDLHIQKKSRKDDDR